MPLTVDLAGVVWPHRHQLRLVELVAIGRHHSAWDVDLRVPAEMQVRADRHRVRREGGRIVDVENAKRPHSPAREGVDHGAHPSAGQPFVDLPDRERLVEHRRGREPVLGVEDESGRRRVGLPLVVHGIDEERVGPVGDLLGHAEDEDAVGLGGEVVVAWLGSRERRDGRAWAGFGRRARQRLHHRPVEARHGAVAIRCRPVEMEAERDRPDVRRCSPFGHDGVGRCRRDPRLGGDVAVDVGRERSSACHTQIGEQKTKHDPDT